ncbi:hypothetical protein [Lacticaseibacillus suibinensis]|nr:hypothetical protein [Lacticaseibacillus suibinensis]
MKYRIQLDTKTQQFIAIDPANQTHIGRGTTIEQAVAQLSR